MGRRAEASRRRNFFFTSAPARYVAQSQPSTTARLGREVPALHLRYRALEDVPVAVGRLHLHLAPVRGSLTAPTGESDAAGRCGNDAAGQRPGCGGDARTLPSGANDG